MNRKNDSKRASGILLHITSLPSAYGIGDLGPGAYQFVDFLESTKQSVWQVLPLNPTDGINGHSPYSSISAFGANTLLISPQVLIEEGLLTEEDTKPLPNFPKDRVDYEAAIAYKEEIFNKSYSYFKRKTDKKSQYEEFCLKNSFWLDDFALYVSLKNYYKGIAWSDWPREVRDRDKIYLEQIRHELIERINKEKFLQFIFFKQWLTLKLYCQEKGIQIIGDVPIYVNYDSVDVWTHPELFKLDKEKKPQFVAGVPPDYFSKTGQRWGNPVYRWDILKRSGFVWWIKRLEHNLKLFDLVRIDHFRGFVAYWEIPASCETAVSGKWVKAPAKDFFKSLLKHFSRLPLIAEDLGIITMDVRQIMKEFGLGGMKVLMFAFGEDKPLHPYLPHNYIENCFVYTGTHDNNTARGWFENEARADEKKRFLNYIGHEISAENINWEFIRLAFMSVANTAIVPMQDILGLSRETRMNTPSTVKGNWLWRLSDGNIPQDISAKLLGMTEVYARVKLPVDIQS
ncbi:MAG: 4-alpha-glucanotransferase [Candidatus Omnitrophota bacterium]